MGDDSHRNKTPPLDLDGQTRVMLERVRAMRRERERMKADEYYKRREEAIEGRGRRGSEDAYGQMGRMMAWPDDPADAQAPSKGLDVDERTARGARDFDPALVERLQAMGDREAADYERDWEEMKDMIDTNNDGVISWKEVVMAILIITVFALGLALGGCQSQGGVAAPERPVETTDPAEGWSNKAGIVIEVKAYGKVFGASVPLMKTSCVAGALPPEAACGYEVSDVIRRDEEAEE